MILSFWNMDVKRQEVRGHLKLCQGKDIGIIRRVQLKIRDVREHEFGNVSECWRKVGAACLEFDIKII